MNNEIKKPNSKSTINIPGVMIPSFRTFIAIENKVEKNLLFKTWGGLGDQVCAEPTLRYALKSFPNCDISLASELPSLFSHLNFKSVFNLKELQPIWDNYFIFDTIVPPNHLTWEFMSHCIVNCVDFPSLCSLRSQLPVEDREIFLRPTLPKKEIKDLFDEKTIVVHAGKHWVSKTFPKDWWDKTINHLCDIGLRVILIGKDTDDNRTTVDVDASRCFDLRNKTTLNDLTWICQHATILITNDSSPLHLAASRNPYVENSGQAWIGYIATCKHPDYITHFRRPKGNKKVLWQWREENLGLGGMWDLLDNCPNKSEEITVDKIDEETLRTWLPQPEFVMAWALDKLNPEV